MSSQYKGPRLFDAIQTKGNKERSFNPTVTVDHRRTGKGNVTTGITLTVNGDLFESGKVDITREAAIDLADEILERTLGPEWDRKRRLTKGLL